MNRFKEWWSYYNTEEQIAICWLVLMAAAIITCLGLAVGFLKVVGGMLLIGASAVTVAAWMIVLDS